MNECIVVINWFSRAIYLVASCPSSSIKYARTEPLQTKYVYRQISLFEIRVSFFFTLMALNADTSFSISVVVVRKLLAKYVFNCSVILDAMILLYTSS
jgi:hypothetical protein